MGSGTLSPTGRHGDRSGSGGLASAHGSNAVLDAGGNGVMSGGAGNGNNGNMQVSAARQSQLLLCCPPSRDRRPSAARNGL